MAKENMGGLSATIEQQSKLPLYGASDQQLQALEDSQKKALESLEQRYAQPNWFKVAAGFAKPQLGGFLASIGSASDALGENIEQQRAQQLPIAQMRAQLAQTNVLMGSQQKANEIMGRWKASGKPMDQATYAEVTALAPTSSAAAAAKAAYEGGAKETENTRSQQRMLLDAIQIKQSQGKQLSKSETDFLNNFGSNLLQSPEFARASNIAQINPNPDAAKQAMRAEGDVAALKNELSRLEPNDSRRQILEKELSDAQARLVQSSGQVDGAGSGAAQPTPEKPRAPYPATFQFPDVSNMSDPERESRKLAYQRSVEAAEKKSEEQFQNLKAVAADPVYSSIDSEYKSAINLLEAHPKVAKAVFNLLRQDGSVLNQVMSAAQAGVGVNLGNMAANLNLPVDVFSRAGLNEEQQLVADRLVRAMLVTGTAKLASQGMGPEKGQASYDRYLQDTKASLQQNAITAMHNLQKDYVTFRQNKNMYDQIKKEHPNQQKFSPTPYTDVINNSPDLAKINERARAEMEEFENVYSQIIREKSEKQKAGSKR
jgi:hypothetical protein